MAEPQDFPRAADDSFVIQSWAESGTAVEPSAGRKATGWVAGDVVTEGELNWLDREPMRSIRAVNSRAVTTARLFGSWVSLNGYWDNGPNPLEGYLSDGAAASRVADVYVDTGTGAVLMQVTVPLAAPNLFSASRTHWIAVPFSSIAPPKVTLAELSIQVVGLGNPDPGAPAGFVTIWRVDTNATTITGETRVVPEFPALREIGIVGDLHVSGTLDLDGLVTLGAGMDANNQDIQNVNEIAAVGPVTIDVGGLVVTGGGSTFVETLGATDITANSVTVAGVFSAEDTVGSVTVAVPATFNGNIIVNVAALLDAQGDVDVGGTLEIDALGTLTCLASATFSGSTSTFSGTNVSTGLTTTLTANGAVECNGELKSASRMRIRGTVTVAAGDLSVDASDNLRFRDATATKFVHVNASGWVLGLGRADTLGVAALTQTLDTATAIAPLAASDLVVEASVWVSRAVAGIVTISLTEVGVGQIGTNDTFVVPATGGSNFYQISFSRTRVAVPTSPTRIYRLTVDGGASNVTCRNGIIRVGPAA